MNNLIKRLSALVISCCVAVGLACIPAVADTDIPDGGGYAGMNYPDRDSVITAMSDIEGMGYSGPRPSGTTAVGIDVSYAQGSINWDAVKADGIQFAIIRCGYGQDETKQDDTHWLENVRGAQRVGIPFGVYIYSYAKSVTAAEGEAAHVLRCLRDAGLTPGDLVLPVYFDVEENGIASSCSPALIQSMATAFCNKIEQAGYRPGIYGNPNWFTNYYTNIQAFRDKGWSIWLAQWGPSNPSMTCELWQSYVGAKQTVGGIKTAIDMDVSFISLSGWKKAGGKWYYFASGAISCTKGWVSSNGKWYYMDPTTGAMKTGWVQVKGKWYYLNSNGAMQTGWVQVKGKHYYLDETGAMQTGWTQVGSSWYYLGDDGAMRTGWQSVGGSWYLMDSNGVMLTGWQKDGDKWYYLGSNGKMQTGIVTVGDKIYYLSNYMKTGWQSVNGTWYYFNNNAATNWTQVNDKWYYFDREGKMATGLTQLTGKWYYLGDNGVAVYGWKKLNGSWYWFSTSNFVGATGVTRIDGKNYLFTSEAKLSTGGWTQVGGKWYYANTSGIAQTGWVKVNGYWYYMGSDFAMQTGWQKINNKWYYLGDNGRMRVGWIDYNGNWYYTDANGVMVSNTTRVIDGKTYRFDANGRWIR